MRTAARCRRTNLPEEPCMERTASLDCLDISEAEVRKIFHVTYASKDHRHTSAANQKERIARSIADVFCRRYELRYNMMKGIDVQLYLHSTRVKTYDPVMDFLHGCGAYRSTVDHIALLVPAAKDNRKGGRVDTSQGAQGA